MKHVALLMLLASACWSSPAGAFWQRSHWAACSEAPTEAQRIRLNCYIFAPAYEWPVDDGRSLTTYRHAVPPAPPTFLPPRFRK